jgi:hypothetical protein
VKDIQLIECPTFCPQPVSDGYADHKKIAQRIAMQNLGLAPFVVSASSKEDANISGFVACVPRDIVGLFCGSPSP